MLRSKISKKEARNALAGNPISFQQQQPQPQQQQQQQKSIKSPTSVFNCPPVGTKGERKDYGYIDNRGNNQLWNDKITIPVDNSTAPCNRPRTTTVRMSRNRLGDSYESILNYVINADNIAKGKHTVILGKVGGNLRRFTISVGAINTGYTEDEVTALHYHIRAGDVYISVMMLPNGSLSIRLYPTLATRGARQRADNYIASKIVGTAEHEDTVENDLRCLIEFLADIQNHMPTYYAKNKTCYRETAYIV